MLVLTRKNNQRIMIGNDIAVTVLECRGDRVRLGIAAPIEVPVHREELLIGEPRGDAKSALRASSELESPFFAEYA